MVTLQYTDSVRYSIPSVLAPHFTGESDQGLKMQGERPEYTETPNSLFQVFYFHRTH